MAGPNDTQEFTEEDILAYEDALRDPNSGLTAAERADVQMYVDVWRQANPKEAPQDRDAIEAQENAQRALYGLPDGSGAPADLVEESSGIFFPPGKPKGYDEELTPDFDEATGRPNLTEWDDMQAFFEGLVPYGHEASTAIETAIRGKPEHTALQKRRSQAGRLGDKVGDVAAATAMSVLAPATIPGQAAAGAGAALYGALDDRYADPYTFLEYEKRSVPREATQGAFLGGTAQGTANALQSLGRFGRDVVGRYGEKVTDTGAQTLQRGAVESSKSSTSAQEAFERAAMEAEQDVMTRGNSAQQSAQDASRYGSREGTGAQSRLDDGLQSSLNEAQKVTPQSTRKVVEGDRTYTKTEPGGGFDENINPMMDDEELQYALDMPIENVKDKIHDTGRTVTTETPESVAQSRGTTSTETRNQSNVASAHAEEFAERANQVAEAKTQMERQANSKRSQLGTTDSSATSASSEASVTGPSTDVAGPVTQTTRVPFYDRLGETWGNLADIPAAMLGKQPFPPAWMERNVGRFDWLDKTLPRVSDAASRIRERGFSPAVSATPYLAESGAVFAARDAAGRAVDALVAPAPTSADDAVEMEDPIQQSVGYMLSAYGDELDPAVTDELTKAYIRAQQSGDVQQLVAADYNAQMNDANYRRMRRALLEGEDND